MGVGPSLRPMSEPPRSLLSDRLKRLVSRPPSPRADSLGEPGSTDTDMSARAARTAAAAAVRTTPSAADPHQNLPSPVLRWLAGDTTAAFRTALSGGTVGQSPSTVDLSDLDEALGDDLPRPSPRRPRAAPEHFRGSRAMARPPQLLDSLARSTLPTASLSQPDLPGTSFAVGSAPSSPPFFAHHPNRRASSADTLRSFQARNLHTSSPTQVQGSPPNNRWWFPSFTKNADPLLDEDDKKSTSSEEEEHIRRKYRSPENPVVFCHGLLGFDSVSIGLSIAPIQVTHWRGIREVLETVGATVLMTRVPATSAPAERARVLANAIAEHLPGKKIHLIGHSMGGLDCRYLATHLAPDAPFEVLSVTTIATPHRGSSFADYFLGALGSARLPSVLTMLDMLPNGGGSGAAFEALTLNNVRKFNEETPDAPGVQYFSWGAWYEPGLIDTWRFSHGVVAEREGPNDGLVSIESAKWGTYLGTIENVSHLDLIGWTNPARYAWAEAMGRAISFKPATFYLGVVDHLARIVEQGESTTPHGDSDELDMKTGIGVDVEGSTSTHEAPPLPKRMQSGSPELIADESATSTGRQSLEGEARRRAPKQQDSEP